MNKCIEKNSGKLSKSDPRIKEIQNTIILGNCIDILKTIPENSIDLIFADPPYNLQLQKELWRPNQTKVDAVNDKWDKFSSFDEYDNFCYKWLSGCHRVLKKNGTIWVIGSYHNIFRIGKLLQDIGFWILNDIIWIKTNPMPNFNGTRFNNAHETLIWAAKSKDSKFTFNYKTMKSFNDDVQLRSDWLIPICNGNERLKVNGKKAHSTQKPEALLYRIITATSNPDDVILDPFSGSGTTAAVAKKLGRRYIGIEKEKEYVEISNKRINAIEPVQLELLGYPLEIKKPRVSFGMLIENNYLKIGELLYSSDKKHIAKILANSNVISGEFAGSIHKVSAHISNKISNNGWTFWFVERNNKLISIDELRNKFIKEKNIK
ncbi:MAG TPA: DNA methyltransferase [Candidatus Goldiibacteriota bacterium]|nr:DNA methyltransferase [Candidatus Goldiibacteriota bacterium]